MDAARADMLAVNETEDDIEDKRRRMNLNIRPIKETTKRRCMYAVRVDMRRVGLVEEYEDDRS